jgi:WD40 repeat protein
MLFLQSSESPVYALAFSPDGQWLISGTKSGVVQLWTDDGPKTLHDDADTLTPTGAIHAIDFTLDGEGFRVASENLLLEFAASELGFEFVKRLKYNPSITTLKHLSPTMLVVGRGIRAREGAGSLEIWELPSNRPREPRKPSVAGVRSVSVLPDKRLVAWAEWNRRISIWEITQADAQRFHLDQSASCVSLRNDGLQLAASVAWTVRLFDLVKKLPSHELKGHKGPVTSVTYSPDGERLVSGSWDGTVRFWDIQSGQELACYTWPVGKVTMLAFSADGLRLAVGGHLGGIMIFDVE